jgi:hypothetical protein
VLGFTPTLGQVRVATRKLEEDSFGEEIDGFVEDRKVEF